MSEHLLQLADHMLHLSSRDGAVVSVPGFASINDDKVIYGEAARSRYRLHPRDSFSQFWSQLSLEPMTNRNRHFRHQADIAYGQLSGLIQEYAEDSNLLLALPGHYSREQVGICLGLLSHCPVQPTALADHAVLSAASILSRPQGVFVDMQLHQSVITHVAMHNGLVTRKEVRQIPGTGLLALQESWIALISDAFISQCRFNPRHTAVTEQFIYDMLDTWITMSSERSEIRLEINHKGTLYQATVLRSHLEQKTRTVFSRILRELPEEEAVQLILPESVSALPGSRVWLPSHITLTPETVSSHIWQLADWLKHHSAGKVFLIDVPGAHKQPVETVSMPNNRHLLVGHRSFALPAEGEITVGEDIAADTGLPDNFSLICNQEVRLVDSPEGLLVNGQPASRGQLIQLGDQLGFEGNSLSISVIEVG